jgi:hypothetical protein
MELRGKKKKAMSLKKEKRKGKKHKDNNWPRG